MIVGGNDVIIEAPPGTPMAALVLESVRRYWPESQFQDADAERHYSIHDDWVKRHARRSREFFIYRDPAAVESWARQGATAANLDKMLYFIMGDQPAGTETPWKMTLVCGRKTQRLQRFIEELSDTLRNFRARRVPPEAAAAGDRP